MEIFVIMVYYDPDGSDFVEALNPCYKKRGFKTKDEAERFIEQDEYLIDLIENDPECFIEIMPLKVDGDDV
jgi:hypothetical protein